MSKSAIKALTEAQNIIAKSGVTVNLVGYITDANVRKNWRNADALAALIINSAGNAFQTETSETFESNCFDDMADAVTRYIDSNLDSWNQKSAAFMNLVCAIELVRLEGMVNANMNFEAGVAAAAAKKLSASLVLDPAEAHDIANEVQHRRRVADFFGGLDHAGRCAKLEADHEAALIIDNALDEAYPLARQVLLWSFMDEESRRAMLDANHADALKHDAHYQAAIVAVADNLSQPVWEGASDTVKAEVIKHQRAQAEEGTGTIEPLVVDYAPNVKLHTSQAGTLQLFWSTLNEYQKEFLLNVAHDEALVIDSELASLSRFRLPIPTQEEREARYFRSLTDVELAYGIESDLVPESRRALYVAEAERRNLDMNETRSVALSEIVSGASREQALARFVSRLTTKQLAEALFDTDFPADRRAAYAAELQSRKGDRVSFDDEVLGAVISNLASDLLSEALNSHTTKPEERPFYEKELKRRQSETDGAAGQDGFSSRAVIWQKN